MKIKSAIFAFVVLAALLLAGCKDNTQGQAPVVNPCQHSWAEGVCVKCNEKDPSYVSKDESEDKNEDAEDENGNGSVIPPIDLDSNVEMPFVPAT